MLFKNSDIKSKIIIGFVSLFSLGIISCKESFVQNADPAYLNEINQWHAKRIENLKKENGWLNLVGLYWLKEGENKFGSAKDNDIVFPKKAPDYIGTLTLNDSIVTIKVLPGVKVLFNNVEVNKMTLQNDLTGNPTTLSLNSFRWFIIKRGARYGIRLRDLDAPLIKEFKGIERFQVNKDWRIEASFVPYNPPKKIMVPNILGDSEEDVVSGKLVFKIKDKEFSLDPIDSGDKLFIIFADETNGESTYGAGRFLYTDKQDSTGKVIIDFNKAYNPPCVFTKFATCPLPPEQNRLAIKITAGEKSFGNHK
jgi:uncharacterized protein (DUF1684 family)